MSTKADERLYFPATQRNKIHISRAISNFLPKKGSILEIASGSGEHGVFFQSLFPFINWQLSDPNPTYRKSISSWIHYQGLTKKMSQPLDLEVNKKPWPLSAKFQETLQAIICINLLHISPWESTEAIFKGAKDYLRKHQILILYGPFKRNAKHTSHSNEIFDHTLKAQNKLWGVRDLDEINNKAKEIGFNVDEIIDMPANNLLVIYRVN